MFTPLDLDLGKREDDGWLVDWFGRGIETGSAGAPYSPDTRQDCLTSVTRPLALPVPSKGQQMLTISYGQATDTIEECGRRNQSSGFYAGGCIAAHYPVPAMIGPVLYDLDRYGPWPQLDIIVTDCDECADPRLVLSVYRGKVYSDYPHDSPNYR